MFMILVLCLISSSFLSSFQQEIYPPDVDTDINHTYFGVMMSNRSKYDSYNVIPAIQIALNLINKGTSSVLKGAKLHYVLYDTQCNRQKTLENFFSMVQSPPAHLVALLGSGCSLATAASAEISHFYNITQVSCVSNTYELNNRDRFKLYYQMLPSEIGIVDAFTAVVAHFNWKKIAILVDTSYINASLYLKQHLENGVQVNLHVVQSSYTNETNESIFKPGYRIFVLMMNSQLANVILCKAYSEKKVYPSHLFLLPYMHEHKWWIEEDDKIYNCSSANRAATVDYSLVVSPFPTLHDSTKENDTKFLTSLEKWRRQFIREYNAILGISNYSVSEFAEYCFDAVWAIALAINNTFKQGEWLNLSSNMFEGLTGDVDFHENRIRKAQNFEMFQLRWSDSKNLLKKKHLAHIKCANNITECNLSYLQGFNDNNIWKYGIPYDGVEAEEIITTNAVLFSLYAVMCILGIIFAIVCFVFNFVYKNKKLIRLTSPKINYIICIGSIMGYCGTMVSFIMPIRSLLVTQLLCGIILVTLTNGYILTFLCILAKLGRIYFIFRFARKKRAVKDKHLLIFILSAFSICFCLTLLWIIFKIFFYSVKCVPYAERPQSRSGVLQKITNYCYYQCSWTVFDIVFAILGGSYILILKAVALYLCFRIRKIKIKGLNESKYVSAIVYFSSICVIINFVLLQTIGKYFTILQILYGSVDLVNVTGILAVSFVPKMVSLHRDPDGNGIFQPSMSNMITTVHGSQRKPADDMNSRVLTKEENVVKK